MNPGRPTAVDAHPQRDAIRAAIAAQPRSGQSDADIAILFGISKQAITYYRIKYGAIAKSKALNVLAAKTLGDIERAEQSDADPWVREMLWTRDAARRIAAAQEDSKPAVAVQALAELRQTVRQWAELAGRLGAPAAAGTTIQVAIMMPPIATNAPLQVGPAVDISQLLSPQVIDSTQV